VQLLEIAVIEKPADHVRRDVAGEVRRFAKQAKDVARARRLLAIAAVLEGASWAEAGTAKLLLRPQQPGGSPWLLVD
jgi:hypothetical protein